MESKVIPPWLSLAETLIGTEEFAGKANNTIIVSMFKKIFSPWFTEDSVPWCAAFVGACLEDSGVRSTRSAAALSYESWGQILPKPITGCVAFKKRFNAKGKPVGGHVGFVKGIYPDGRIALLGGNKGDKVSVAPYRLVDFSGFRWPKGMVWKDEKLTTIHDNVPSGIIKES